MFSRFGGEAVPTLGRSNPEPDAKIGRRPSLRCCGESEAFGACMFKVSMKSKPVDADRDGS